MQNSGVISPKEPKITPKTRGINREHRIARCGRRIVSGTTDETYRGADDPRKGRRENGMISLTIDIEPATRWTYCHPRWTFWQRVDILAEKNGLAQMLQDRGCKRKVRVEATHRTLQTLFN